MPLFVKIDFRPNGKLSAWFTRDSDYGAFSRVSSAISETRVRDVLIALADEIDPIIADAPPEEETK